MLHPRIQVLARQQGGSTDPRQQATAPRSQTPRPMLGPDGKPLQVLPVEEAGPEAWAGVAAIDQDSEENKGSLSKGLLMAGGDAAALVLFAATGHISHGGGLDIETLHTAVPFLVGWFATAPFLGGYSKEAQGGEVSAAALVAAKCWAVATPIGLVLRGVSKGYVPPTPFIVVTCVATAVLLVGWRSALAAATPKDEALTPAARMAARKNKSGNPFEFFQLLASLTKRW